MDHLEIACKYWSVYIEFRSLHEDFHSNHIRSFLIGVWLIWLNNFYFLHSIRRILQFGYFTNYIFHISLDCLEREHTKPEENWSVVISKTFFLNSNEHKLTDVWNIFRIKNSIIDQFSMAWNDYFEYFRPKICFNSDCNRSYFWQDLNVAWNIRIICWKWRTSSS